MNKLKFRIGAVLGAVGSAVAGFALATDPTTPQEAVTAGVTAIKTDIFSLLTTNIPTILLVVGALIALFLVVRVAKRLMSR